jgi:CelD/BcsL family acetyltransferase involved in cellulose biosynthesis
VIRLTVEDFERDAAAYDALVRESDGIDRFCSSSEWVLAAREAWAPGAPTLLARGAHGYALFVRTADARGAQVLLGFDTEWGFSSALVGHDGIAKEAALALEGEPWHALLLPGLVPGARLMRAVVAAFRRHEVRMGPLLTRWVASLEGGLDGYLARRGGRFRSIARRAARRARAEGVSFERGGTLERALAVERRSWKGAEGTGLLVPEMRAFYGALLARLKDRARMVFARRGGEDVGYIMGGVRDGLYRGFQFSYDERLAHVSLGSLLQIEQIAALAEEGVATYDMGIDLPYKRRWADGSVDTVTLAVVRG